MFPQRIGRYEIKSEIGRGGMATVYRAYDPRFKREVAVKVLPREFLHDPNFRARFEREAEVIAALEHPAIVPVHDYGEDADSGQPYLVMRLMTGGSLADRLEKGPLSLADTARIFGRLAPALDRAHGKGIIHRDLKPGNILFDEDDNPYIADFGIAKLTAAAATFTGSGVVGTPAYMSPEQARGEKRIDGRSDIYALGAIVFQMLTGKFPYDADTPMGVVVKHITDPVPSILEANSDLPPSCEALIYKAMAKKPADRFSKAVEMARSLESVAYGGAPPPPPTLAPEAAAQPETLFTETPVEKEPAKAEMAPTLLGEPEATEQAGATLYVPRKDEPALTVAAAQPETAVKTTRPRLPIGILIAGVIGLVAIAAVVAGVAFIFSTRGAQTTPTITHAAVVAATATLPKPTPPPIAQPYQCTDSIGCVTIGPTDPIHIAYLMVVAGPDETLGIDSRNGVEIAIDDSGGKILDHTVKFDGEDGGCSAEGGQAAGTKLAADPTIVAVIGTSCSSEARVAVPLMSQAGFVIISPSNTAPDLTEAGNPNNYPGYLRTAHNDKVQGAAAAKFAWESLKVTKAATIHDGSLYADKLQQVFAEEFKKLGGTITAQESVDSSNQSDMKLVLTTIIAVGRPQLIYFPTFIDAGTLIIRQAKEVSGLETTYLMGADGLFSPAVTEGAGDAVEGFMVSSPDFTVFGADYQNKFLPAYQARFGSAPLSPYHAHAYDAFMMVKAAIEKVAVKDADGTLHIPRQALRDAMYATKGFKGLTGNLTCTPTGDCADPHIAVYTYHKDQYPPEKIWPIVRKLTLWYGYESGSAEETALNMALDRARAHYPDLQIESVHVPFGEIFEKYRSEVAVGGGPDMLLAPNDDLGVLAREGLVLPLGPDVAEKLGDVMKFAIDGMSVDGHLYGIPESSKTVALYYNRSLIPEPPGNMSDLLSSVQAGHTLVVPLNAYHLFGFFGAFGGQLFGEKGKCVLDTTGGVDAMNYLVDLKGAGAVFESDPGKAQSLFVQGQAAMLIDGPWEMRYYLSKLGDKLGVAPLPPGLTGPARPLVGVDGFYVNPKSKNTELAVLLALFLTAPDSEQVFMEAGGHIPIRQDVRVENPLIRAFSEASLLGLPRPQNPEFPAYWGFFSDMFTRVLGGQVSPAQGVAEACAAMNKQNGK